MAVSYTHRDVYKRQVDCRVEEKENDRIEVFTKHVVDEYEAELNLFDESSGTKKLFGLLPFIAKSLLKGTTLVIDELDAKIHPVLLKYLIMTFSNMKKNKKGAQLIFTSHDLSTMNSEVFRRDEIWFVAKGNRQNSKLYSLVEFKNKKGESVRKDVYKRQDEEHRLSQKEIQNILKREYEMTVDRKAVKRNLLNLIEYESNIEYREVSRKDIFRKKDSVSYKGTSDFADKEISEDDLLWTDFYLKQKFTNEELRLLIDSLLFSKHIPYSQAKELIKKL